MIFLKELKGNEIGIGTYYRIRKDNTVELGYQSDTGKDYDSTRLIIEPYEKVIKNQTIYKCKISWFNSDDSVKFPKDKNGRSKYDEKNSSNIMVQFDLEKLITDKKYYKFFMENLLKKDRVLKYLEYGMQEEPKIKCGDYVGYIDYNKEGKLKRYFDEEIGEACHNLPSKKRERKHKIELMLKYYNNEIEKHKKAIRDLNQKIEDLNSEKTPNKVIKH